MDTEVESGESAEQGEWHPWWCEGQPSGCGLHMSAPAHVPATAGPYRIDETGATFPRAELSAAVTTTGGRGVHLTVFDPGGREPRWAAAVFSRAEVLRLATELLRLADLADSDTPSGRG